MSETTIDERTVAALGPVHLAVTDAERALAFWTQTLGLKALESPGPELRLAAGARELVVLHPGAARPVVPHTTGLYHLAIHVPRRAELARAIARLLSLRYPNAPTDHLVTETTYLWDPDGNGVELTFETPERGELLLVDGMPRARDRDGNLRSGRDPLDLDSLLSELGRTADLAAPLAPGARIGHVHLHVADLGEAMGFYRDLLGFAQGWFSPAIGMADVVVPGNVPHLIAVNTWAGAGAPRPPADAAGLRHFTLDLPGERALGELVGRLEANGAETARDGDALVVHDPSGNRVRLEHERV